MSYMVKLEFSAEEINNIRGLIYSKIERTLNDKLKIKKLIKKAIPLSANLVELHEELREANQASDQIMKILNRIDSAVAVCS